MTGVQPETAAPSVFEKEYKMNKDKLRCLIIMALCCDLGLFSKRLIAPAANVITDALHIPGGIGTAFSLMFLVVAAGLMPRFWCGTVMGAVQSVIALSLGMVGSMGALSPIGYIVPGFVIDCIMWAARKLNAKTQYTVLIANMLSAAAASITANLIVFRLSGVVLLLYVSVALTSGALCGVLGGELLRRLQNIKPSEKRKDDHHEKELENYNSSYCGADRTDGGFGSHTLGRSNRSA